MCFATQQGYGGFDRQDQNRKTDPKVYESARDFRTGC